MALDCRNWDNQKFRNFQEFKSDIVENILARDLEQDVFMVGLDYGILEMELLQCLNFIKSNNLLESMLKENHIYNQWKIVLNEPRVPVSRVFRRLIKRAQCAPNAQAGCERSNSKYARYKNKYSNRMGIEIIRARGRAGENGPPLRKFPAVKARQYWQENNHRLAKKIADSESLVLARRKKEAKEYTSRIFIDI